MAVQRSTADGVFADAQKVDIQGTHKDACHPSQKEENIPEQGQIRLFQGENLPQLQKNAAEDDRGLHEVHEGTSRFRGDTDRFGGREDDRQACGPHGIPCGIEASGRLSVQQEQLVQRGLRLPQEAHKASS